MNYGIAVKRRYGNRRSDSRGDVSAFISVASVIKSRLRCAMVFPMASNLQKAAQQRVDRIAAFRSELAELEREQALSLTPEQRSRLDGHLETILHDMSQQFGVEITESGRRVSWAMRLGSFLFAAALLAAVILFLHRVWGLLPWAAQVAIPLVGPIVLLAVTEAAARRQVAAYYVGLLALTALTAFIIGLNALGGIWNVTPSGNALLVWGLAALCLAYACHHRLLLGAGLLLACAYVAALWVTWTGGYWLNFFDRPGGIVLAGALIYGKPWLKKSGPDSDFDIVYRLCGAGAALIALLILSKTDDLCCSEKAAHALEIGYQAAGLFLSGLVVFHGVRLGRSGLANLGAVGFVVFLYVRLHAWFWERLPKYLFFLLIALIALALVLFFRRLRHRIAEGVAL